MRRKRLLKQAVNKFKEGYEGTIYDIAAEFFGDTSDKSVKQAYNLMLRVRLHFDAMLDTKGRPIYQFNNVRQRKGPGIYRIVRNADEGLQQLTIGLDAARRKTQHQFSHGAVAVAVFPKNRPELMRQSRVMAQAAVKLIDELATSNLAAVAFYEELPKGETDEKVRN